MALTGYYLFFKGRRRQRLRRVHGRTGLFVGVGLLLLVATGLPWTGFWGEKVQSLATKNGSSMWSLDPGAASDPASTLDESLPHSHAGSTTIPSSPRSSRRASGCTRDARSGW